MASSNQGQKFISNQIIDRKEVCSALPVALMAPEQVAIVIHIRRIERGLTDNMTKEQLCEQVAQIIPPTALFIKAVKTTQAIPKELCNWLIS